MSILFTLFQHIRLSLYFLFSYPADRHVRAFRFGIPLLLKVTPRLVSTEADALRVLNSSKLPLPVPRLIDSIPYGGETFTLMTRLPGRTFFDEFYRGNLSKDDVCQIIDDLEIFLHKLWQLKQNKRDEGKVMMSGSGHGLPDSMSFLETFEGPYDSILDLYTPLSVHLQEVDQLTWDESTLLQGYPEATKAVTSDDVSWVHMDLRPYNILVDNGRLSGVIDWEESGWLPRHWQLYTLRRPSRGNPTQICAHWRNVQFPLQTETAFKAGHELLYYPVV